MAESESNPSSPKVPGGPDGADTSDAFDKHDQSRILADKVTQTETVELGDGQNKNNETVDLTNNGAGKTSTKIEYNCFADIKVRPEAPAIDETIKHLKAHLGTKSVLLEVVQNASSYLKKKPEQFNEDNLCNFLIDTPEDREAFSEYAFRKLKQLATSKDKKGESIPMESIAAWAHDNMFTINAARALLLDISTTRIDPVAREPKEVGNFTKQRFATANEYGTPYEKNHNTREEYEHLHKCLNELRKKIPIVELILKFKIHNKAIIDKAVGYYGEKRIASLNKAKFWDCFPNAKALEAYIDKADNPINRDFNNHLYLSAALCKKAILEQILPAMTYNLKHTIQMHNVNVENIPANYCISTVFECLYKLELREPQTKEVRRFNAFTINAKYQPNRSIEDNAEFFDYLNGIAGYCNDTAIDDLDQDFFEQVNGALYNNMQNCGPLQTNLASREVTDAASLKNFLTHVNDWLLNNDPKAIQNALTAKNSKKPVATNENIVKTISAIPSSNFNEEIATIREATLTAYKTRYKNACSLCIILGYNKRFKAAISHPFDNCRLAPKLDIKSESEVRAMNIDGTLLNKISNALQDPKPRNNDRNNSNDGASTSNTDTQERGYKGRNFDPDFYRNRNSNYYRRDNRDYRDRDNRDFRDREYRDRDREYRDRDREYRDRDRDRDDRDKPKDTGSDKKE